MSKLLTPTPLSDTPGYGLTVAKREATPTRRSQRITQYKFEGTKTDKTIHVNLTSEGSDEAESVARVQFLNKSVKETAYKKSTKLKSVKLEVEKKRSTNKRKKPAKKIVLGKIKARSSPRWLKSVLKSTTGKQKDLIRDIGFGPLLDCFNYDTVPLKLGLFVVQSFDPDTCRLNFPDGRAIKVTKELIHDVVGLPITNYTIDAYNPLLGGSEVIEEFRQHFEVEGKEKIIVNRLHDWMVDYIEGDRWYKLSFLAFVTTLLIECSPSGTINESIIPRVDCNNVDILHYDWCGYILDAIVRMTTVFKPTNHFDGPLLILVVIYVHCTTIGSEEASRMYPGIRNWNSVTLTARENEEIENGGFGLEHVRILEGYEEDLVKSVQEMSDSSEKKRKRREEMEFDGRQLKHMDDSPVAYGFEIGDEHLRDSKMMIKRNLVHVRKCKEYIDNSLTSLMSSNPFDPELLELAVERNSFFDVTRVLKNEYAPDSDDDILSPTSHHVTEIGQSSKKPESSILIVDPLCAVKSTFYENPAEGTSENPNVVETAPKDSALDVGENTEHLDETDKKQEDLKVSEQDELEKNDGLENLKVGTSLLQYQEKSYIGTVKRRKLNNDDFPTFSLGISPDDLRRSDPDVLQQNFQQAVLVGDQTVQNEDQGCVVNDPEIGSVGKPFSEYEDFLLCQVTDLASAELAKKKEEEAKKNHDIIRNRLQKLDVIDETQKHKELEMKKKRDEENIKNEAEKKTVEKKIVEDYLFPKQVSTSDALQLKNNKVEPASKSTSSQSTMFAPFAAPSTVGSPKATPASSVGPPKLKLEFPKDVPKPAHPFPISKSFKLPTDPTLPPKPVEVKANLHEKAEKKVNFMIDKTVEVEVDGKTEVVKISDDLVSPYLDKEVCVDSKLTVQEERVCRFIFSAYQPIKTVYFKNYACNLDLQSLESLYVGIPVQQEVIDVWTQILNYEESDIESTDQCGRVFCDTETMTYNAIDPSLDQTVVSTNFEKSVKSSLMQASKSNFSDTAVVFFPIVMPIEAKNQSVVNHYYLICFNLKVPGIYIIDSIKDNNDIFTRYGNLPNTLRRMFCEYLGKIEKHTHTVELMAKEIKILDLEWSTKKNYVDCGVFLMRHMECYKGTSIKEFKTQLHTQVTAQKKQIEDLRKKYLAKILLSTFNDDLYHVKDEVKAYDQLDKEIRLIYKKNSKVNICKRSLKRNIVAG